MASYDFSSATSVVASPAEPLNAGEITTIWESDIISQGASYSGLTIKVKYEGFTPDTAVTSPFNFEVTAVVEQQQADNSWEEIGRQNTPIRKLERGAARDILISPGLLLTDEGVDQNIPGLGGSIAKLKSFFKDNAQGDLRVLICVIDYNANGEGLNPFENVTFSISGHRYD